MTTKIPVELSSTPSIVDNNDSERIRIDSAGNVGVGTSSPATLLHVESGAAASTIIRVKGTVADGYRSGFEAINGHTGGLTYSIFSTNNSDGIFGGGKFVIGNDATNSVNASTAGLLVMDSSGNVGIGTTSPSNKLDVNGAIRLMGTGTDNDSHILYFNNGACTIARDANDLELHAYNAMVFGVSNTSYPTSTERMRINSSGTLQIGKTSSSATDAGHQFFQSGPYYLYSPATQAIRFYNTDIGSQAGHITISGSTISMANGTSDLSTKENINDWNENVLESFKNIKPVTFNYKNDKTKEVKKGYIAQNEVDKFPEAYAKNSEDNLHWFHPSEMTVYLMKAIQEQQAIIEDLQTQINEVKNGN